VIRAVLVADDGRRYTVEASAGTPLMQAAKNAAVPGIDADCGGSMVCGTCHVYVPEAWRARMDAASEMEAMILEGIPQAHADARLSCQIPLTEALDGLTVSIPPCQR
jgi:2Fe-2S ferredoxin